MGRNRHDGARTIAREYIVADPDGHFVACEGVDSVAAGKYTGLISSCDAVALGLLLGLCDIGVDGLTLLGSRELGNEAAFGRKYHEGDAKHGVGACGKDGEGLVAVCDLKLYLGTFAASDPVALGLLDGVAPVDGVESVEEALGVG